MISKELLSEILGSDIYLKQEAYDGYMEYSNIYELAHKCKEWAFNQKLLDRKPDIYSGLWKGISSGRTMYRCILFLSIKRGKEKFEADTEPEAIFKACEWILKENG